MKGPNESKSHMVTRNACRVKIPNASKSEELSTLRCYVWKKQKNTIYIKGTPHRLSSRSLFICNFVDREVPSGYSKGQRQYILLIQNSKHSLLPTFQNNCEGIILLLTQFSCGKANKNFGVKMAVGHFQTKISSKQFKVWSCSLIKLFKLLLPNFWPMFW